MPQIQIHNCPYDWRLSDSDALPSHRGLKRKLAAALREAVLTSVIPGISEAKSVSVSETSYAMLEDDTTLIIKVVDLFDHPERTIVVKTRLAEALLKAAADIMRGYTIEVIIDVPLNLQNSTFRKLSR